MDKDCDLKQTKSTGAAEECSRISMLIITAVMK